MRHLGDQKEMFARYLGLTPARAMEFRTFTADFASITQLVRKQSADEGWTSFQAVTFLNQFVCNKRRFVPLR